MGVCPPRSDAPVSPLLPTPLLPSAEHPETVWGQLYGCARGLAIASGYRMKGGHLLVLAGSAREAENLSAEIRFFAPELPLALLPDYETLPYDPFSPHPELVAERLAVLYQLSQGEPTILVANADSLTNRLPPPDYVIGRSLKLATGQSIDLTAMRRQLSEHGYLQVPKVTEHGEFAVRGALIDLFPAGSADPVRVDLFDDEIEGLRVFDPGSQLSSKSRCAASVARWAFANATNSWSCVFLRIPR